MNENTHDDPRARLKALARVPPSDPFYRDTCIEAVELADCLNTVSLDVENLLADFIRSGPTTQQEVDAFLTLAKLYLRHGFAANGLEAAEKLARARPGDPRAVALLEEIRERGREVPSPTAPPALPPPPAAPKVKTRRLSGAAIPAPANGPGKPLTPGTIVARRYQLINEIGKGGMSIVYRARDADLGEEVALKFLTGGLLDDEAEARFKLELKLSRQLVHPNIVRLYDIGRHDELRFISMELLSGRDLARILRGGPLRRIAQSATCSNAARRSRPPMIAASSIATSSRPTCS